jgi:type II secretory ATPase GspE/PulE/Tfp pilus assembly ATPase PilB-like protein
VFLKFDRKVLFYQRFFLLPLYVEFEYSSLCEDSSRWTIQIEKQGFSFRHYVDNQTRQMISEKAGSQAIKDHATTKGMKTLYMDGLNKVARGVTTLQEVVRVTQRDHADIPL